MGNNTIYTVINTNNLAISRSIVVTLESDLDYVTNKGERAKAAADFFASLNRAAAYTENKIVV